MKHVSILNGKFHVLTMSDLSREIEAFLERKDRGYIATVNVAILMMMRDSSRLQNYADRASFCVADGYPIVWVSRWFGSRLPERITGVDLVDELCAIATRRGLGVYLLGANQEIIEKVAEKVAADHPGLRLAGFSNGYFSAEEASERAQAIAAAGTDILIIAMGVPRQEVFIEDYLSETNAMLAIGVGGSFDVLAGVKKRAPRIVQKTGFEWLFRLVQEPRRLAKRYLVTNTQFIFHLAANLLRRKPRSPEER